MNGILDRGRRNGTRVPASSRGGLSMNAAIIGGGVGGLLSALYLSNQGVEVTIYEKEEKLGGRLAFVGWGIRLTEVQQLFSCRKCSKHY